MGRSLEQRVLTSNASERHRYVRADHSMRIITIQMIAMSMTQHANVVDGTFTITDDGFTAGEVELNTIAKTNSTHQFHPILPFVGQ